MRWWGLCVLAACTSPTGPEVPEVARAGGVNTAPSERDVVDAAAVAGEEGTLAAAVGAAVPELPQVWSAPNMQYSLAAVDGGAGVVGRVSLFPETIARVDARTGKEVWRVAQPGEVMWTEVRAGKAYAAVSGRLPARGGDRVGYVDLRDGKLLWSRAVEERTDVAVGLDGTGVGLVKGCNLTALDPQSGRPIGTLRGRMMGVGHSGPDGPQVHEMCGTTPLLVGQTDRCAMVLAPHDVADMLLTTVGPDGSCWKLPLGRADLRPTIDAASDVLTWHAESTLHVLAVDRATGDVRWRRNFAGPSCYPRAHVVDVGGRMVVVHACGTGVALAAADGAERWSVKVDADAVAVVGEAGVEPLLMDSPGVRYVQYVTAGGVLAGRIEVADGASAHAVSAGLMVQTRDAMTLWDAQGERRWWRAGGRFSAIGDYVVIKNSGDIVDMKTGRVLGRDPFDARPLAVVRGEPTLMVMHAGYLWARALPGR
jgi:outer membrane protein assembly factor BamB